MSVGYRQEKAGSIFPEIAFGPDVVALGIVALRKPAKFEPTSDKIKVWVKQRI